MPCCTGPQCPRCWSPERHASLRGILPPGVGFHPLWGLSPWGAQHLLVPQVLSSMRGAIQRPRMSKCQKPRGRELAPSSKVHEPLYQESDVSILSARERVRARARAFPGVSNPWPVGRMRPRMAMNAAQHKIINLLKTFFLLISFH